MAGHCARSPAGCGNVRHVPAARRPGKLA
jgi:hypothetical protein